MLQFASLTISAIAAPPWTREPPRRASDSRRRHHFGDLLLVKRKVRQRREPVPRRGRPLGRVHLRRREGIPARRRGHESEIHRRERLFTHLLLVILDPLQQRLEVRLAEEVLLAPHVLGEHRQRVPGDARDLLPGQGRERGLFADTRHDEQPRALLQTQLVVDGPEHDDGVVLLDPRPKVHADLLGHLARRAVSLGLVLVDLTLGEAPPRVCLVPLHHQHLVQLGVEDDDAAGGHAELVVCELLVNLIRAALVVRERLHLVEHELGEVPQAQRLEVGLLHAHKVLVVPVRLLDEEHEPLEHLELLGRAVGHEPRGQLFKQLSLGQVLGVQVIEQHLGLGDESFGVHHVGATFGNRHLWDRRPLRRLAL